MLTRRLSYDGGASSGSEIWQDGGGTPMSRHGSIRRQVIANRQEAVEDALFSVSAMYWLSVLFGLGVIAIGTFVEVRSLYVLVATYSLPCDEPLWRWLAGHTVLSILREFAIKSLRTPLLVLHTIWAVLGFHWYSAMKTCKSSNPELTTWVGIVLIVTAVVLFVIAILPVLIYLTLAFLVALVDQGVLTTRKAAREGTLERLEVVAVHPELFAPANSLEDPRPSAECCCCWEVFSTHEAVVKTPCCHYYHRHCLGDWLKLARTCPICRTDLEHAVDWDMPGWAMTPASTQPANRIID